MGGWLHDTGRLPTNVILPPRKEEPRPTIDWQRRAEALAAGANGKIDELARLLGVSDWALHEMGVGYGSDEWDGRAWWSFPERTGQLRVTGISRRYRNGEKKHMKWSRRSLYIIRDWWKTPGPVLLPEGGSDTAAILTMGLCAIGRPSNTGGVNLLIGLLKSTNRMAIVLAERDQKPERRGTVKQCPPDCAGCSWCFPGLFGARQTAEALSAALGRKIGYRFCGGAKDVRAWLNGQKDRTDAGGRFLCGLRSK